MKKVSCHRMHQRGILMNMWLSLFCMALECFSTALLCQACCPSPAIWLSKCKDRKTPCKRGKEALVGCHCPHYTALHLTLTVLHWLTLSSWQIISLVKFNLNFPLNHGVTAWHRLCSNPFPCHSQDGNPSPFEASLQHTRKCSQCDNVNYN